MSRVVLALAVIGTVACTKPAGSVQPAPAAQEEQSGAGPCRRTGCSSEVCSAEEVFSPCIFRPEFECYDSATCEMQADGQCGWTTTPELEACLADPPGLAAEAEADQSAPQ